ncbi:F-box/kelch-repeat protein At3g06240-like [Salvia miltiorrhiza]|uniref:F-box/kelch-repeat protein At3g06240-like n=1 Tax=Salvia miltiorrhiza TaxID=226208 RepID=UPI0025AC921D|nr:F-box/kelch-repeat protein At3g06240-like [Salvia miltiorrhiza]
MADDHVLAKLPLDVVFQILTKLPTKSLLQLRSVSKSFNPLILHPHFLKLHLANAAAAHRRHVIYYESTDYIKAYFSFHVEATGFPLCKILETPFKSVHGYLRIVGSDRGVLCLFDTNYFTFVGTVILWNPFIGKFKILPCPNELSCFRSNVSHIAVGFGFDCVNFDFKVVKILYSCDNDHEFMPIALIFSVKSGFWRSSGLVVPCYMPKYWCSSVFVNGVVHWLAYKQLRPNGPPNCIMGFDVVGEVFNSIEIPPNLGPDLKELRLCSWVDDKSVALFVGYRENVGEAWDLWVMNEYGQVGSWTRNRTIVLEQLFFPLKIVNGGDVLAAIGDEKLVAIDVENEEVKDLEVCGLPLSFYAATYTPTLALLDIGEQILD